MRGLAPSFLVGKGGEGLKALLGFRKRSFLFKWKVHLSFDSRTKANDPAVCKAHACKPALYLPLQGEDALLAQCPYLCYKLIISTNKS